MKKINNKGITLIALVITIIVLLILAGVSIAMLTGQNGILTQAQNSKEANKYGTAEEKVKLSVMAGRNQKGNLIVDKIKSEISNQGGSTSGNTFPIVVIMDGYIFEVDGDGNVSKKDNNDDQSNNGLKKITGYETKNTTTQDSLGNQVVVPAGFKVVNPDSTVTDGIIIEDVNHVQTKGSQFVWIAVGDVKNANGDTVNIPLGRYSFDTSGNTSTAPVGYTEDTSTSHKDYCGNKIAKDIEKFRENAKQSHGYYIGRYEARTATQRPASGDATQQITEKPDGYIYNYVTQLQASDLSQNMYSSNDNFESDLINSEAWDTAIVFLQNFDNRSDKTRKYAQQISANTGTLAETGTNNLSKQDTICNVFDMASNCTEWTTETYAHPSTSGVRRGGFYKEGSSYYTAYRNAYDVNSSDKDYSFRPILYLKP